MEKLPVHAPFCWSGAVHGVFGAQARHAFGSCVDVADGDCCDAAFVLWIHVDWERDECV